MARVARVALTLALALAAPPRTTPQAASTGEDVSARPPHLAPAAAIALAIRSRAIQDSRCYLEGGGAVESFFISEDTPVGAVVGVLSVQGNAGAGGDITLTMQERDAPLALLPGTKNVTLVRALDREERRGPATAYVNVRCDRRGTADPSFVIPVSVRVWDVNDNAPTWTGTPHRARLSELTGVGTRVLPAARATDIDQPGPHATVHYKVLPGPHSEYLEFANELDSGSLVVKKPLDYENLRNFTVWLRAQDGGTPPLHADAALHVDVLDADDQNPKFSHDHYTTVLPDDAQEGDSLETSPGQVSARDQDTGIGAPLRFSAGGDGAALVAVHPDTGQVTVTRELLQAELPLTIVLKATQVDNPDRYALATLTVTRGARDAPSVPPSPLSPPVPPTPPLRFAQHAFAAAAREDTPPGTVLTALRTDPPAHTHQRALQFFVSDRGFLQQFAINGAGEVLLRRPLDYEAAQHYGYQVMVTDGLTNDTASINISVVNVNEWEPRFRYPQYEFRVDAGARAAAEAESSEGRRGGLLPLGRLEVFDGDRDDTVSLSLRGSDASMLYINKMGELFVRQEALSTVNTTALHVVATAEDSGDPPRQSSVPVVVSVTPVGGAAGSGGGAGVAGALGGALALLTLVVAALLLYVCRGKRSKPTRSNSGGGEKAQQSFGPPSKPVSPAQPAAGSLQSISAGASTILGDSCSSLDLGASLGPNNIDPTNVTSSARQSQRFSGKSKIAPAPPVSDPASGGGAALMSDHLQARAGRSGVAWPSATIPARVKKLSWDDGQPHTNKDSAETGAVHDATNPALGDHMNLTVYF